MPGQEYWWFWILLAVLFYAWRLDCAEANEYHRRLEECRKHHRRNREKAFAALKAKLK